MFHLVEKNVLQAQFHYDCGKNVVDALKVAMEDECI